MSWYGAKDNLRENKNFGWNEIRWWLHDSILLGGNFILSRRDRFHPTILQLLGEIDFHLGKVRQVSTQYFFTKTNRSSLI